MATTAGTVTDSYWDTALSGVASGGGGTGKTTSQLQSPTSNAGIYANWGTTNWDYVDANHFPLLKADWDATSGATSAEFGDQDPEPAFADNAAIADLTLYLTVAYTGAALPEATGGNGALTYSIAGLPAGLMLNAERKITGTPTEKKAKAEFTYTVADTDDGADTLTFNLQVVGTDYDSDDDGLIEVANLAQLNAIRWDLDGDGAPSSGNETTYATAFPYPFTGMGCPTSATDADDNDCTGYELTADLDFDSDGDGDVDSSDHSGTYWNSGKGWTPIGGNFAAEFDGGGHTITNLFVDGPSYYAGLFNVIGTAGKVRNLGLVDVDVTSTGAQKSAGGVAGVSNGAVSFSYVSGGTVDAPNRGDAGGLVGTASAGTITASFATADVTIADAAFSGGGLVGGIYSTTRVEDSYAAGSVTASVGKIAGLVGKASADTVISNSYSLSTVNATGTASAGGLVITTTGTVTNSYWDTALSGVASGGGSTGKTTSELQSPTSNTGIYATWGTTNWDYVDANHFPLLKADWDDTSGATWAEFGDQDPDPAFDDNAAIADVNLYANVAYTGPTLPEASEGNHPVTYSVTGLPAGLTLNAQHKITGTPTADLASTQMTYTVADIDDGTDSLTFNLEVGGTDYDSDNDGLIEVANLAQFNAIRWDLDGNGSSSNSGYATAFPNPSTGMGCPTSGTPTGCIGYELSANLDFDSDGDADVDANDHSGNYWDSGKGWDPIGSASPYFNAEFEGNNKTITRLFISRSGNKHLGLFANLGASGEIRNLKLAKVSVSGSHAGNHVGGLVGVNRGGDIDGSSVADGAVKITNTAATGSVGGLVGFAGTGSDITGSHAGAAVTQSGDGHAGGLVGENKGSINGGSYATGAVAGNGPGAGNPPTRYTQDTARNCPDESYKSISSNERLYVRWPDQLCDGDGDVGGLVGWNTGTVTKSYATGAVTTGANSDVGGLIGVNDGGTISFSYATGLVTIGKVVGLGQSGGRYAGGLVGWNINEGSIASSFSASDVNIIRPNVTSVFGAFGGVVGRNSGGATISAVYYTGAVAGGWRNGGLVGDNTGGHATDSYVSGEALYGSGLVGSSGRRDWLTGKVAASSLAASYWDIDVANRTQSLWPTSDRYARTTRELQGPTANTGIYADWDAAEWEFGSSADYPLLKADWNGDGTATAAEFGNQIVDATLADYDLDDDGLIEVFSMGHLNAIRYDLDGNGSVSSDDRTNYEAGFPRPAAGMGCPATGCKGYELDDSLNFDGDGDGDVDINDHSGDYWDSGKGWTPIGGASGTYTAVFEGNGHTIANLFINRASGHLGLFRSAGAAAKLRGVGLTGVSVTATGAGQHPGALVGANGGAGSGSYATGTLTNNAGSGGGDSGGLVGNNASAGSITDSYATGAVSSGSNRGGLVGANSGSVTASYWDRVSSGQTSSAGGAGKTGLQLRVPTSNTGIYAAWSSDLWDFGGHSDLLELKGHLGAQYGTTVDYDYDDDGLIEVFNLAQLNAIRWDLDGDGTASSSGYAAAFANAATGMGCNEDETAADDQVCKGYELAQNLSFDTRRDGLLNHRDAYWNNGAGWNPIGGEFTATLDGNGYAIDLLLSKPASGNAGLFDTIGLSVRVRNLGLTNVSVASQALSVSSGGLAGENKGLSNGSSLDNNAISAVYVTGEVTGKANTGCLFGKNSGDIGPAYSNCSVSTTDHFVGGLVGTNQQLGGNGGGRIHYSYAAGPVHHYRTVSGSWTALGGLVGRNSQGQITRSYARGAVTRSSTTATIGGLVGVSTDSAFVSYWDTTASGQSTSQAGQGKSTTELQTPTSNTGIYSSWGTSWWDFGSATDYPMLKADLNGDGTATAAEFGSQTNGPAVDYDKDSVDEDGNPTDDGNGLIDVSSLAQLYAIRYDLNGDGKSAQPAEYGAAFPNAALDMGCPSTGCIGYELMENLDFDTNGNEEADAGDEYWNGGAGWTPPAGRWDGIFDGNGKTISNLFINLNQSSRPVGLFSTMRGTVRDLGLEKVSITTRFRWPNSIGGIVGFNDYKGLITTSYVSGVVDTAINWTGSGHADATDTGCVAGRNDGTIKVVYADCKVVARGPGNSGGGLVGTNFRRSDHSEGGIIENTYASNASVPNYYYGSVFYRGMSAAGLVGVNFGTGAYIKNSYALGRVDRIRHAGLTEGNIKSTVIDSYWDKELTRQTSSAGSPDSAGKTSAELKAGSPSSPGIYTNWSTTIWHFEANHYPALIADFNNDGTASAGEFGKQDTPTNLPSSGDSVQLTQGVPYSSPKPLPQSTTGNGPLSYSISGLPPGLAMTEELIIEGTAMAPLAKTQVTLTVEDTDDDSDTLALTLSVAPKATVLAAAGNGEATLTWTAIAEVSGWQVQQDDGDWTAIADSDDQTSEHTVGDLVGGATYTFKVRAVAGTGDTLVEGVASNAVSVTPTVTMDTYTVTHVRIGSGDTGSAAAVAAATKTSTGLGDLTVSVAAGSSNADILAAADALTEHSVTTNSRYIDADGVVWNFRSGKRTYWLFELTTPGPVDTTPSFGANASIADQSLTQGVAYTSAEAFPEADGGDGDIAYAVDNLPSGLSLNAARKITGTATAPLAKTEYTYTATDSDATGPDSATLTFYISVKPKTTALTATAGNGEATLTWTAIAGVSGWQVQQDDGDWTAIADSDDQTSEHTVGDLVGGATYTFKVRAVAGSGDTLVAGVASNAVSVTMDTYTVTHVRISSGDTGSAAAVAAATKTSTGLGDLTVSVAAGSSNADILAAADALTEHSVTTISRYIDADGVVWNFRSGRRTYWLFERQ